MVFDWIYGSSGTGVYFPSTYRFTMSATVTGPAVVYTAIIATRADTAKLCWGGHGRNRYGSVLHPPWKNHKHGRCAAGISLPSSSAYCFVKPWRNGFMGSVPVRWRAAAG